MPLCLCRCAIPRRFDAWLQQPLADADGNVQVLRGDRIPAVPQHRFKARVDFSVTDAFKVGADMLFVGSQYFVGDDSNQAPKLPSYAVFNLHGSYQINKTFQVYARADNVFDHRYSTHGTFFNTEAVPNFANGGAAFTDPRSLSPARPRAFTRAESNFLNPGGRWLGAVRSQMTKPRHDLSLIGAGVPRFLQCSAGIAEFLSLQVAIFLSLPFFFSR